LRSEYAYDGGTRAFKGGPPWRRVALAANGSGFNVSGSRDDVGMGNSGGVGVALEGVQAAVAALDALDREDAFLASGLGVGSGVDVLQRR